ncbi:MAG: hypothetical protein COA78_27355 [Blastopirellula sp.]|nr:MAG: hypothetical protein COA78_27355 [Blastopirellula sp.]
MMNSLPLIAFVHMSPKDFSHWVTSLWLLGVGVGLGLAIVLVVWAVLRVVAPALALRCSQAVTGPILTPISIVMGIWVIVALLGTFVVREPTEILNSLARMSSTGEDIYTVTIPKLSGNVNEQTGNLPAIRIQEIDEIDTNELKRFTIQSSGRFELVAREVGTDEDLATYSIQGGELFEWTRSSKHTLMRKLPSNKQVEFYARNDAFDKIKNVSLEIKNVSIVVTTEPAYIEAKSIFYTMMIVAAIYLFYFLMAMLLPKVMAIAEATATSEMSQLLFLICATIGCLYMVAAVYIPYHTFGEDIKVLKHTGLQVMMMLGLIVAIWASSTSIADEIEGKTALTLLSKPISRRQFIFGKYIGIAWTVAVLFIIVTVMFLPAVASKPVFDQREGTTAEYEPTGEKGISWQLLHDETVGIVPGVFLVFMETIVLASLSVAISTRMPMVANFMVTFGVYALAHLTPSLLQASSGGFEPVKFVAMLLAIILPPLKDYEVYAAVSAGTELPVIYLPGAALSAILYSAIAMLLALILFEDRDLT